MTWVKFSDDTPRTAADLSDAEFRLWFDLHCHSMTQLSDGALARRDVVWVLNDRPESVFHGLLAAGRVEPATAGWRIVGFEESQSTAAEIEDGRARAAIRQARQRKHRVGDHSDCQARYCSAIREGWKPSRVTHSGRDVRKHVQEETESPVTSRPPEAKRTEVTQGTEVASLRATASACATASARSWRAGDLPFPELPNEDEIPCNIVGNWDLTTSNGAVCVWRDEMGCDQEMRAIGESYAARGAEVEYGDGLLIRAPIQVALWRELQAKLLGWLK